MQAFLVGTESVNNEDVSASLGKPPYVPAQNLNGRETKFPALNSEVETNHQWSNFVRLRSLLNAKQTSSVTSISTWQYKKRSSPKELFQVLTRRYPTEPQDPALVRRNTPQIPGSHQGRRFPTRPERNHSSSYYLLQGDPCHK